MAKDKKPVAVIVAPVYVNGVAVMREMAAKGAHVVAVDYDEDAVGFRSRAAAEKAVVAPPQEYEGSFAKYLLSRRDLYGGLVIPTDDFFLREIYGRRAELEPAFKLCISAGRAVEIALDKALTAQAAQEAGVDIPRTMVTREESDLKEAERLVGFPAIVKPVFSHSFYRKFGTKVFVVGNHNELRQAYARARAEGEETIVQEIIPGADEEMVVVASYWNSDGKCAGELVIRKTHQYPPEYGVGQLCRVDKAPEAAALSRRVLEHIAYRGAVAVPELKFDRRDNRWKLIEINARTCMQTALLSRAGCDLLEMMWRDKLGLSPIAPGRIRYGMGWAHEKNGILRYRGYPEHRLGFWEYVKLLRPPIMSALLKLSDPLPFIKDVWPLVRRRFPSGGDDAT